MRYLYNKKNQEIIKNEYIIFTTILAAIANTKFSVFITNTYR